MEPDPASCSSKCAEAKNTVGSELFQQLAMHSTCTAPFLNFFSAEFFKGLFSFRVLIVFLSVGLCCVIL